MQGETHGHGQNACRQDRGCGQFYRQLFRTDGERHECEDRGAGRSDHVPDDGLYHLRQSEHSRQGRNGPGRGVRRHLHRSRGLQHRDGAVRELPDRARAGHGAERVLRLHGGADLQIYVAAGARRGVPVGRAVLHPVGDGIARIHHQPDPAEPEIRHRRRRRTVPRHHRARKCGHHRRPPGDAGDARPSQRAGAAAVPARLHPDRGVACPRNSRRNADRHPDRWPYRPSARAVEVHRHRVDAAVDSRRHSWRSISRAHSNCRS